MASFSSASSHSAPWPQQGFTDSDDSDSADILVARQSSSSHPSKRSKGLKNEEPSVKQIMAALADSFEKTEMPSTFDDVTKWLAGVSTIVDEENIAGLELRQPSTDDDVGKQIAHSPIAENTQRRFPISPYGSSFASVNADVGAASLVLEDYPALLSYITSEMFAHASLAEASGADPTHLVLRLLDQPAWPRWVALREDLQNDMQLLYYAATIGLQTWIRRIGNIINPDRDIIISRSLNQALEYRDTDALTLLFEHVGSVKYTFSEPNTLPLLHRLVVLSDLSVMRMVLDRAASMGKETVREMMDAHLEEDGSTALHMMARRPNTAICSELLLRGAEVDATDGDGLTTLHHLCLGRKSDLWLEADGEDPAARVETIGLLLDHGANIEARAWGQNLKSPLHLVCDGFLDVSNEQSERNGDFDVLLLLLERGANVEAVCSLGRTPLYCAVTSESRRAVAELIRHGASVGPYVDDLSEQTPLHVAVTLSSIEVAAKLLDGGASIDAQDRTGRTALYSAAEIQNDEIVELLLSKGTNAGLYSLG